jgi:hypothetical protein
VAVVCCWNLLQSGAGGTATDRPFDSPRDLPEEVIMTVIRVREVADGEELVVAEETNQTQRELGLSDPRSKSLERRHKALTHPPPRPAHRKRDDATTRPERRRDTGNSGT